MNKNNFTYGKAQSLTFEQWVEIYNKTPGPWFMFFYDFFFLQLEL